MKQCPECQQQFECTSDSECWCFNFPRVRQTDPSKNCLCPACLLNQIANEINHGSFDPDAEELLFIKKLGISEKLTLDIDYYLNEDSNFVFTKWYHLKKGYCCNNSCKHCPYK